MASGASDKTFLVTWLLALFLGFLAADRFYLGKIGTAIAKLLTLGGLGIWVLVDLIMTLAGAAKDKQGRPLAGYQENKRTAWIVTGVVLAVGMISQWMMPRPAAVPAATQPATRATTASAAQTSSSASAQTSESTEASAETTTEAPQTDDVATWAASTFGTFAALDASGNGDDIIDLPAGATVGMVTATHNGSANFVVNALDSSNDPTGDLLVNTIGDYSGTTAYGLQAFGEAAKLQVTADGSWSIRVAPLSEAPELATSGTGDAVMLYGGPAGSLALTHDGGANFVVREETEEVFEMGLLVNEIGAYDGTVPLSAGPSVVWVNADGAWTAATG